MIQAGGLLLVLCAIGAGCGGTVVSLGDTQPPPFRFGPPRPLNELGTTYSNENPTLTGDLRELWFNSNRGSTGGDVWVARRESPSGPFTAAERVDAVSSDLFETSSAISLDGLTIYFGSDRPGGLGDLDIWRATRASRAAPWSAAENLTGLNTAVKDLPRPLGLHELMMPLSSQRDSIILYQTFFSRRASAGGAFGAPVPIPELAFPDRTTVDAFLSDDGLALFYSSAPEGAPLDIYVAWRKTTAQPFSLPLPLDLDTAADERDPWLSPDGTVFYFTSDRNNGVLQIFEAPAARGPIAAK